MQEMEIITLPHYEGLELPVSSKDNAGVDLRAAFEGEPVTLEPGEDVVIPSGLKVHIGSAKLHSHFIEIGLYGAIMPRSGLGFKHYVRLANTTGVIDAGYLGEIMIKIRNEGHDKLTITRGDRICQMVFQLYMKDPTFKVVPEFTATTDRGESGFGDSGVK